MGRFKLVLLGFDLGQTDLQLDQVHGRLSVLRDSLPQLELLHLLGEPDSSLRLHCSDK